MNFLEGYFIALENFQNTVDLFEHVNKSDCWKTRLNYKKVAPARIELASKV